MDRLSHLKSARNQLMTDIFEQGTNVKRQITLKELDEDIIVEKLRIMLTPLPKQEEHFPYCDKVGLNQNNETTNG